MAISLFWICMADFCPSRCHETRGDKDTTMTDFSDERAAKRAAIRKARNSTKPTVPADQVFALLDADLARIQAAIDTHPTPHSTD